MLIANDLVPLGLDIKQSEKQDKKKRNLYTIGYSQANVARQVVTG